jgi:hypothetical protein
VLKGLPALLPCRAAAALLVLALSGAPGLVPRAVAAEHRCQCQGAMVDGRHVCSCPICRLAGARARAAERARSEGGGVSRCSSRCDDAGGIPGVSSGLDPFVLPRAPALVPVALALGHGELALRPAARPVPPDLPPPRAHQE